MARKGRKAVLVKPIPHYSKGGLGIKEWVWPIGTPCTVVVPSDWWQDYWVLEIEDPNRPGVYWGQYASRNTFEYVEEQ